MTNGIVVSGTSAAVVGNRVFNNQASGIRAGSSVSIRENTIYSNAQGLTLLQSQNGLVENNLIYGNREYGIVDTANNSANNIRKNNTVYQVDTTAVWVNAASGAGTYRNNIIVTGSGVGLSVAPSSQPTFSADYNLIYVTGTGSVGRWLNRDRKTLADWQSASAQDTNSLSTDPRFVSPTGNDNQLGYASSAILGNDDNFHLMSTFGSLRGSSLSPVVFSQANGFSLPTFVLGTLENDANSSPAIDAV